MVKRTFLYSLSVIAVLAVIGLILQSLQRNSERFVPQSLWEINEATANLDTSDWNLCDNQKAGYRLYYPKQWEAFGDGATDAARNLIGPTPCQGFGVLLTNTRPTYGQDLSNWQSVTVTVEQVADVAAFSYMKARIAKFATGDEGISPELFLQAYAGTTTPTILRANGVPFIMIGPKWEAPTVARVYQKRLYSITPSKTLDLAVFQTILATLRFRD